MIRNGSILEYIKPYSDKEIIDRILFLETLKLNKYKVKKEKR